MRRGHESDKVDNSTGTPKYSSNHKLLPGRKDDIDSPNDTGLPVNLTTPPLTPPRENLSGEVPVNVNRNNVSDSVHVKATQFSASVRQGAIIGAKESERGKTYSEVSHSRVNGGSGFAASHAVDSEPPALVIVTNSEAEEEPLVADQSNNMEEASMTESRQGAAAWKNGRSVEDFSLGKSRAVEQDKAISDEDDEEEVEDMELVLVEEDDQGMEEKSRHVVAAGIDKRAISGSVKSMEAESSTTGENGHMGPMGATHTGSVPSTRERANSPGAVNSGMSTVTSCPDEVHTSVNFAKTVTSRNGVVSSASDDREAVLMRQSSPARNGGNRGGEDGKNNNVIVSDIACSKRAAKVKQFFSTIQQCANGLGRDVAEQVQELIHAVLVSGSSYN